MQTPEAPREEHTYPHQGHLEPVSPELLAEDVSDHPEAYHPELVKHHIEPFLAKQGVDLFDKIVVPDGIEMEDDANLAREVVRKIHDWKEGDAPFTHQDAYLLLDEGYSGVLADNLSKFGRLHSYIAETLIDDRCGRQVAEHPEAFYGLTTTLVCELIEKGFGKPVLTKLDQFNEATIEAITYDSICNRLIAEGNTFLILRYIDQFPDLSYSDLARKLIQNFQMDYLLDHLGEFKDLDPEIAYDQLLGMNSSRDVLKHLNVFRDIDHDKVAHLLFEMNLVYLLANSLHLLFNLSEEISSLLILDGYGTPVIAHMSHFQHVDQQLLVKELIGSGYVHSVVDNIEKITDVDHTSIAIGILRSGNAPVVLKALDRFGNVDRGQILDALWAQQFGPVWIAASIDKFPGVDRGQVVDRLIASGNAVEIAKNMDNFPDVDQTRLVDVLIDNQCGGVVLRYLEKFTDVDEMKVLARILKADVTHMCALRKEKLTKLRKNEDFVALVAREVPQLFTDNGLPEEVVENAYPEIVEVVGSGRNEIVDLNAELFGAGAGATSARMLHAMLRGSEVPEYARELGITQVGPEAIEQLKAIVKPILKEINACNFSEATEREIVKSELLSRLLAGYTGFTDSEWGESGTDALKGKLKYRLQAQQDGRIEDLRAGYEPSEVYEIITTSSKEMEDEVQFSEDAVDRYKVLVGDLTNARSMLDEQFGFGRAISELRQGIFRTMSGLQKHLEVVDEEDPKAEFKRTNLEARIESLKKYLEVSSESSKRFVLNSPVDFERGIVELAKYPELHSGIRSLTFAWAMRKNPQAAERLRDLPEEPTIETLSSVREFIEHIVNQETYGSYFRDKKSNDIFKRITSTKALEEAMFRYNQRVKHGGNTTPVQFVPTRGALMEMSGQIANACWADKYKSIAEEFPNFTAVMIRARPGKSNERLVGSAMLIETSDPRSGQGVLLLRGTNPRENYINKIDVGGFYDAITDYVRKIAERRGLKPAIVIDDHSGGSGTNRPVLHGYFVAKKQGLRHQAVDDATTYFNGYDVTMDSYAL